MSGGSLDYLCYKLEDALPYIKDIEIRELTKDFAKLLHDVEWEADGDICAGTLRKATEAFKIKWLSSGREERLEALIDARIAEMRQEIMDALVRGDHCKDCVYYAPCTQTGYDDYGHCVHNKGYLMHGWERCDRFIGKTEE